jgi:hypothetical protein
MAVLSTAAQSGRKVAMIMMFVVFGLGWIIGRNQEEFSNILLDLLDQIPWIKQLLDRWR